MDIKRIVVGSLETNCYILTLGYNVLIIDPGADSQNIIGNIPSSCRVVGIITTHSHDDHIGAVGDLLFRYKCPVYNRNNLDEGSNSIENFNFKVIYTPGHMSDSIVIYFEQYEIMFVGDFIFKGAIGRMDLPGGNSLDMKDSILKILKYPSDTILYPGHGESTTLGDEVNVLNYFANTLK